LDSHFGGFGGNRNLPERSALNSLTLFGFIAVSTMVVFYALENRNTWFILAFAVSCVLGSIYGFLQGSWPFGMVEAVWATIALRRWWLAAHPKRTSAKPTP
jgi:hypothetical protein